MKWLAGLVPAALAVAGVISGLCWWNTGAVAVMLRLPGADKPPGMAVLPAVDMAGHTVVMAAPTPTGLVKPGEGNGEWSGFRGSAGTGVSAETGLVKNPALAKVEWQVELGEGYGGAAVRKGRVFVLDYDATAREDALRCLSTEDGREIWRHAYKVDVKRNHGMSRTVPAVDDDVVVTLGPRCQVVAVALEDGRYLWGKDLVREYGSRIPPWYAGQCPLLRDGKVYLAPAGEKVLLTAVEAKTGKVLWEVPNPSQWTMTHSSIAEVMVDSNKTLVYCGSGGAVGVDESSGKLLWESTDWKVGIATVPTPVDLGEGRILFTGGYGAGAMIGRVVKSGEAFSLVVEKRMGPAVMGSEQQTPVVVNNGAVAVIPNGEMVFMSKDGEIAWHSGGANRYGSGPYLVADGVTYVVNDTGVLSAVAADAGGFRLLGKTTVFADGRECWGPMALADGRLYVRDFTRLVCLDLRAK